ncbi:hypothetical protein OEZ86_006692 [Tetradesmus obliquus]|nr:hypothetical protein OEZ86_006692 [Tetradesmus obliquus]
MAMANISFCHTRQSSPVLLGNYALLPGNNVLLQDEQEPVLRGSQNFLYDLHAPAELHGSSWVRAQLHNNAQPCCHWSGNHPNRPVASTALSMDFGQSLAAVSGEWWLCRSAQPDQGQVHVFDNVCLIPTAHDPPVNPDILQGELYAQVELLPAAAVLPRLKELLLEMPALAAQHHVPRAHLHVAILADALPVVQQEAHALAGGVPLGEWDDVADMLAGLQAGQGLAAAAAAVSVVGALMDAAELA